MANIDFIEHSMHDVVVIVLKPDDVAVRFPLNRDFTAHCVDLWTRRPTLKEMLQLWWKLRKQHANAKIAFYADEEK